MSTIDPFAFGKGLQQGTEFNPAPDPLKQAQIQAATLDRQMKAQQLQVQTQELRQKMQEQAADYNSKQAFQYVIQSNKNPTASDFYAAGVLPKDVGPWLDNLEKQNKDTAQKVANQKIMTDRLVEAFEATGEDDPDKLLPVQAEQYRQFVAEGLMPQATAQKSLDSGQVDTIAALKAHQQRLDEADKKAAETAKTIKDQKDADKAAADAAFTKIKADRVAQGLPPEPSNSEYDQKVAAHNASPDAAIYGKGPIGMQRADDARKAALAGKEEAARLAIAEPYKQKEREIAAAEKSDLKVASEKYKADQVFNDATNGADQILGMIKLVRAGNKEASSALPMLMVGAINRLNRISRINQAEINSMGPQVGSLIDKLYGQVGSISRGIKQDDPVLNDAEALFNSLINNAATAKQKTYATIEQDFGPKAGQKAAAAPSTGPEVGDVVSVRGQRVKVTGINSDGSIRGVPQK